MFWLILTKNIENAVCLFKRQLQKIKKKIRSVISKSNSQSSKEVFLIKSGYDSQLANNGIICESLQLELSEREKTKISSLKIGYSSVHGHYIESAQVLKKNS